LTIYNHSHKIVKKMNFLPSTKNNKYVNENKEIKTNRIEKKRKIYHDCSSIQELPLNRNNKKIGKKNK
jgi:hypothetical protein